MVGLRSAEAVPARREARVSVLTREASLRQRSDAYFGQVADRYASLYREATAGGHSLRQRRLRLLELLQDLQGRLLDVGCGPGIIAPDLSAIGFSVLGVDASPQMIDEGRGAFREAGAAGLVASAEALPFKDASLDVVVCLGVIGRLPHPDTGIAEMSRVLKPQGTLAISFANRSSPYTRWRCSVFLPLVQALTHLLIRLGLSAEKSNLGPGTYLHTRGSAEGVLRGHELELVDVAYYNVNLLLSPIDEVLPRFAMGVAEKLEGLRLTRGRWLATGFIAVGVKDAKCLKRDTLR